MWRFYQGILSGQGRSAALAEAKHWLRNLTRTEMEELAGRQPLLAELTRALGRPVKVEKGRLVQDRPFSHPYYWAPFILTGDPR
jgi:CHAT domain-containing protein